MMDITLVGLLLGTFYYFLFYKVRTVVNISQLSYKTLKNWVYNESCNQPISLLLVNTVVMLD